MREGAPGMTFLDCYNMAAYSNNASSITRTVCLSMPTKRQKNLSPYQFRSHRGGLHVSPRCSQRDGQEKKEGGRKGFVTKPTERTRNLFFSFPARLSRERKGVFSCQISPFRTAIPSFLPRCLTITTSPNKTSNHSYSNTTTTTSIKTTTSIISILHR